MNLRDIPLFAGLSGEQLDWLASVLAIRDASPGEVLFTEGEPPAGLFLLLDGELTMTRLVDDRQQVGTRHRVGGEAPDPGKPAAANSFTGEVQLLTGNPHTATATVTAQSRIGVLSPADFQEMLARCPQVAGVMLPVVAWRLRMTEMQARERSTLAALSTVAAGLAHELNNPAAAARRASGELPAAIADVESAAADWAMAGEESAHPRALREELRGRPVPQSALGRADREDEIEDWLVDHDCDVRGEAGGLLADAGADAEWLSSVGARGVPVGPAVRYLCALLAVESLTVDLADSVGRVSALVDDVRTYTQLDRAPEQEVDIHAGLDSTLRLLSAKLRGVTVERSYDPALPRLLAKGAELNQVWTNIIDNALDALGGSGTVSLRTWLDGSCVSVEIGDDGPGIPPEVQARLFEPFFTTKDIGSGTGLGLHIVYRIVTERHGGSIEVYSQPGRTRFVIRLPAPTSPTAVRSG
ncbi:cyclic nucleotide-binding domain-containing protein [Solihabitans fulvus]|uniref:histidine kinase n=1 Tax=Solihabitans fulvus TaxID=1892852 RepID=A0A5B2WK12_9PSEU|nr:ATP-binding protein [Solihabitans fulvus]KAA2252413.1 cyclic nucleotide-binding domain-containing protein [Solihabitans fulvus]